jgi:iron(II)-dependent oxidoreductase
MDRTEVTNQQYLAFVEATGRTAPLHWRAGKPLPNEANLPVVNVAWEDARDFATWAGKRLPTEEEWEFAARSTDGRLYPWGNAWEPSLANILESKTGKITDVGRNLAGASPYGIVDMCGNVWEWTSSELRAYGTPELLEEGVRVIRGGAFDSPKEFATTTYRGAVKIGKPYPKTGFRCAKDLP